MLGAIWGTIGIIIGMMILIPLLLIFAALIVGCSKEIINLTVETANVIAAWIDGKIHKK